MATLNESIEILSEALFKKAQDLSAGSRSLTKVTKGYDPTDPNDLKTARRIALANETDPKKKEKLQKKIDNANKPDHGDKLHTKAEYERTPQTSGEEQAKKRRSAVIDTYGKGGLSNVARKEKEGTLEIQAERKSGENLRKKMATAQEFRDQTKKNAAAAAVPIDAYKRATAIDTKTRKGLVKEYKKLAKDNDVDFKK